MLLRCLTARTFASLYTRGVLHYFKGGKNMCWNLLYRYNCARCFIIKFSGVYVHFQLVDGIRNYPTFSFLFVFRVNVLAYYAELRNTFS